MGTFILGTAGFILYLIYDVNNVKKVHPVMRKFFGAGSLCVTLATVWELVRALEGKQYSPVFWIGWGLGGALFFSLLVYTLFFALPFEETYLRESDIRREAYMGGIYSLCRHPGVLWFTGLFLCLWGLSGNPESGKYFLSMILWNVIYIIIEDVWTFPNIFVNYGVYKKCTPFLIPNGKSIRQCWGEMTGKGRKR